MDIYEEWDIYGRKGKSGDGLLNDHGICHTTLDRIIREGRKKQWPRYGAKKGSHETRCSE